MADVSDASARAEGQRDPRRTGDARDELEAYFRQIVESIPVPVAVTTPDGEVESLNQSTLDYFGRSLEELKKWKSSDAVHPDDLERTIAAQMHAHVTGEAYNVESRHLGGNGSYKWFNVLGLPLKDESGNILRWFHIQIDIDDKKRAEELLRNSEQESRLIVDTIPGLVATFDARGQVESVNRQVLEYFGCSLADMKTWEGGATTHPEDLERAVTLFRKSIETGEPFDFEVRALRRDGVYRWFQSRGFPLRDLSGKIIRWFNLLIDIDDRKSAEEALETRERDLKLIIDTIPALAWAAGPNGRLDYFNQHSLDYLGMTLDQATAGDWAGSVHPDDERNLATKWKGILTSEQPGETEFRLRRHDGEYRWFLLRANPLRDESGRVIRWYGVNTDLQDWKEGDEMLRESEQRFRTLFEEAGAGITLLELDPVTPIRTNRAMQTMLERSEDELTTVEMFTDLTAPEDRTKDLELFVELRQGKRDHLRQEKHFILKDGRSVWANGIFTLLRDESGAPKSVISIHEDITERKQAIERLQANQDLLDLAQKSAGAMAFDWYIQEEINSWSPEQEALFGLKPGSFDGTYKTWKSMMYPGDWPTVVEAIQHAKETGKVSAEYRVMWPDGSLHWLSTSGRMFFDEEERPLRMVGFTSDVTRRKLIEEELRRSEAFLVEGQRLAKMGNFTWNLDRDEILWSDEMYRIFEFEPGLSMTLELIATRVHPEDMPMLYEMVDRARRGVTDFEYEHRLLLPDGSVKHLQLVAHKSQDVHDRLEYIGAVQDVTQRRLSEEALSEARSELAQAAGALSLGVLTASIAHEVNQPLSGIITNANTCVRMLDAEPPNIEGARETARRTIRDGNRASEVIARLRALFGKKESVFETVDLNDAAREVVALSSGDLRRGKVILETSFSPESPLVHADRIQLQQVMLNLLRNASDSMDEIQDRPRRLMVGTYKSDDQAIFSVRDSGAGIGDETLNKLFDAFFTTKTDGMGIGLSVSKSIIESHDGRLWAAANEGPGSTFSFSLHSIQEG
jgi:PAS domain S-box-containing protein